jgi:hypothetical protein
MYDWNACILVQVIGNDKKNSDHNQKDEKIQLRFLAENDESCSFIQDLNELRKNSTIFPPLKTFNGLPPTDLAK